MNYAHFQIKGRRKRQEDAYYISADKRLYAVCDGVGGSDDGQLASNMLVEAIGRKYLESDIRSISDFKTFTSELVNVLYNKTALNIATTMSLVYINSGSIYIANIGDTRVYVLDTLTGTWEMTRDHSIVQELFEAGILHNEAEMRRHPLKNQITKAISSRETITEDEIEFKQIEGWNNSYHIILASDGVFEAYDHEELIRVLMNKESQGVEDKVLEIESRCKAVSSDNSTCIIIEEKIKCLY